LQSIADGVITTDTKGRIILVNQIAEELTGWKSSDAAGRPLNEVFIIFNKETADPIESPVETILAAGEVIELASKTTLIDKNGREKFISDSGAPIKDKSGKIIGVVLVFRDISEQLRTEQELLKIKKLESIGVLAGGIAHDYNNLLTGILGNIDMSLQDSNLSAKTQNFLNQAQNATFRAKDLTLQLLTFAKGGQPVIESASLTEVIKDSADFALHGTKVACRYQFPKDLWLVDIDKGQMSQVIQNIIINASYAMPDGGVIEVSCENVSTLDCKDITSPISDRYVKLKIKDSGQGIPAEVLDKIFDPYFTTKPQGSGLGLAITHSIINNHSGSISVQSTFGVGTTFTVCLPASAHNVLPAKKVEEFSAQKTNARIMVMDDEEIVRNIAEEMLTAIGHTVLLVKNGTEAVQKYKEAKDNNAPIDLIIMDLTIPGEMGGQEAVKEILNIDSKAKVIVSSGYSEDPAMAFFENYGFCAAIAKPYTLSKLTRVVNRFVD
jgi:two-component system cell cycle sensor histidine kinase/response regulator CckA